MYVKACHSRFTFVTIAGSFSVLCVSKFSLCDRSHIRRVRFTLVRTPDPFQCCHSF